jgi:glycosyltransferase involved in cell wall biosynthesis
VDGDGGATGPRVVAVVAARDEAGLIGATVEGIRTIPLVDHVVVVDDGSTDDTAERAVRSGARVLMAPRNLGKGGALEAALDRIEPAQVYLLLDADLGDTAKEAGPLLDEVLSGRADLAVGVLPRDPRHGGFLLVKHLGTALIRLLSGFRAAEPLSGQRALHRRVLEAVRPLAGGFGVETAMTIDAVRMGFRVREVPVAMQHVPTARDLHGIVHRARQGRDVLAAAVPRALRLR